MKKAKGVKETKERFSIFPFLFSPLSPSTVKRSSGAGVAAALEPGSHWLPSSGDLHFGGYKSGGGSQQRSSSRRAKGKVPSVGGIHASSEPAGASELQPADFSCTRLAKQACTWEPGTHARTCKPQRKSLAQHFGIALGAGGMSPARRGGSPCLFPLQLFSLCWVLSVAQS